MQSGQNQAKVGSYGNSYVPLLTARAGQVVWEMNWVAVQDAGWM